MNQKRDGLFSLFFQFGQSEPRKNRLRAGLAARAAALAPSRFPVIEGSRGHFDCSAHLDGVTLIALVIPGISKVRRPALRLCEFCADLARDLLRSAQVGFGLLDGERNFRKAPTGAFRLLSPVRLRRFLFAIRLRNGPDRTRTGTAVTSGQI
jgi:hypothetical protein